MVKLGETKTIRANHFYGVAHKDYFTLIAKEPSDQKDAVFEVSGQFLYSNVIMGEEGVRMLIAEAEEFLDDLEARKSKKKKEKGVLLQALNAT